MVKSMTGFGRGSSTLGGMQITAELKSVNHRYCEISVKSPRRFSFAEEALKTVIKNYTTRGKIELNIQYIDDSFDENSIHLNMSAARAYYNALNHINDELLNGESKITLQMLASNPDVLKTVPTEDDEEALLTSLCEAVKDACEKYDTMRLTEGEKLAADIIARGQFIENTVSEIAKYAPQIKQNYYEKLKSRITDILKDNVEIPTDRILVEAAVYADKIDITEEITRLKSHCDQLKTIISESKDPAGKQLDFLVQEMNRESNTICSKCNDIEITKQALSIKNEIEKIREQIQNIE